MKKYAAALMTLLVGMTLTLALVGCAGSAPKPDEGEPADQQQAEATGDTQQEQEEGADDTLTFSMYFVDPESSPYVQGGQQIAQLVKEATDGRITIEVIAGSPAGERRLLEAAMGIEGEEDDLTGTVDIATCANSVLTNYIPQMNILDQAYLWKNADEAHAAVDGTLGQLIQERAETLGLHVIGFEESGFRNTFSTKPIQSMADFEGITIRTMENKYHMAAFESFGATTKPMAYDKVMPALESGEIDACENATANCLNSGYYEVTKNVTNTQHAFVYIVLCMSDEAWNAIPEELRQPFMDAVQEGVRWERERLVEANADATQKLRELGVSFYDIDVTELQAAYQAKAASEGFSFDEEWQAAVDEAVAQAAS